MKHIVDKLFKLSLLVTLILSIYIFIMVILFGDKTHNDIFSTWQMPMLFAIFMDIWRG